MKRILLFGLLVLALKLGAQPDTIQWSLMTTSQVKKRSVIPAIEMLSVNTIINRIDYWGLNADWADVSWESWKENIRRGFESDGDAFGTNFFGHPYHGSLFYNAARSNGRSFWGSIPYVVTGSLVWEYFGETYAPSEIDMGTTVYGGIYLGEISHRLTTHLLSRVKYSKGNKLLSGLTATILNPLGQINGLLYDDVYDSFRRKTVDAFPIRSQLSVGANFPIGKFNNVDASTRLHINYSMLYGDLFEDKRAYKPFDFFVLRAWADISTTDKDHPIFFNVASHAPLWRSLISDRSVFSISNHYDFLNNEVFKIGAMSITGDYSFQKTSSNVNILASAKLGMILFGSSSSEVVAYLHDNGGSNNDDEFFRDYVYGRGITFELESMITFRNESRILLNFNNWILYTKSDAAGTEKSSVLEFNYFYPIFKKWSIGLQAYYYHRSASYPDLPPFEDISNRYIELKIMSTLLLQ